METKGAVATTYLPQFIDTAFKLCRGRCAYSSVSMEGGENRMSPFTKIRRERGLSMSEFARMLDLAVITLVRIEGGRSRLPLKAHSPITKLGLNFFQLMIDQEHYIRTRRR